MKSPSPAPHTKTFELSASYKVDKMTFIVNRVFREDAAENIRTILERLIQNDPQISQQEK